MAASDFYGPLVRNAHAGERMVPTVLAGRTMRVVGSPDQPHSFTYVPDLAAAMIAAAARPDLWNSFLHAPTAAPVTQRRLVELVAEAGGVPTPRMSSVPVPVLGAVGLVSRRCARWPRPATCSRSPSSWTRPPARSGSGSEPTPLADGLARTVAWWRAQQEAAA